MRATHYPDLAQQIREEALTLLRRLLRPKDWSRRCPAPLVLSCPVLAALGRLSLAAAAVVGRRGLRRETLRQAALAMLPDYAGLRRRLPAFLRASLPRPPRRHPERRRYALAVDLHRVPYYQRGRKPPAHVRKGQRLPGTRYAHDYASASLRLKGRYFVVALTPCDPGEDYAGVVRRLLRQAAALGFRPRCVPLDRTFWSAHVFRYLQRARTPFLIPVLARGKKPGKAGGPTGTQQFFYGHASGRFPYRVTSRDQRRAATVTILVYRRKGARGRNRWAYALGRMDLATVRGVRQSYRRRFGSESSYRLPEAGRACTSSRDERLRLGYALLAALLVNLWLQLRRRAARCWGTGEAGQCWCAVLFFVVAHHVPEQLAQAGPAATPQTPNRS